MTDALGPHNCGTLIHDGHVLFKPADGSCISHVFDVGAIPAIISGFEFSPSACATLEMVAGCGAGEYFSSIKKNCGCPTGLNEGNNQIVVSVPGRYRLVWCDCDVHEGYVELRYGNVTAHQMESSMANSCCGSTAAAPTLVTTSPCLILASPSAAVQTLSLDLACLCTALTPCIQALIPPSAAAHNPASILGDPAVTVTGGGASQAFTITFAEVEAASQLVTNPSSLSILCSGLIPCITALIPGGDMHPPAVVNSSDGTLTVVASGIGNQAFDIQVDCAALKAKCNFLTLSDSGTLCSWASLLPNVGPLQA